VSNENTLDAHIEKLHQLRSHYPQCKTCIQAYSFIGETCGWVCDGRNDYSEITQEVMIWLEPKNQELRSHQ